MKTRLALLMITAFIFCKHANSQIVINEVCSANDTVSVGNGTFDDWIEIYNNSSEQVNLNGWMVSDNPKKPAKYTINEDLYISPGSFFLILCNGVGEGLEANFKLSSEGETVVLTNPSGETVDKVTLPQMWEDRSYGRAYNGDEWAMFEFSTPGKSNSITTPSELQPKFSLSAGFYTSSQLLEITCDDPNATIYYTTDGSIPTKSSKAYVGKISITSTKVIRAIATRTGYKNSAPTTATFFINSRAIDMPVVCLSTASYNFWSDTAGIYVDGTNGAWGNCADGPKNWNQPWEKPIHFEYFDADKNLQVSADAGIKVTGSCSRGNAQKSLRVIARKEYGPKRFCYKFFDQKDISEFKSVVLRSGANDWNYTMLRDPVLSLTVGQHMDVDYQAYKPCSVFLNGEYLGMFNMREKVSTHMMQENYGVDDDQVNLLENQYSIVDGSSTDYVNNVYNYAQNNDLSNSSKYNTICQHMDIDNFIDYWIAEIYIDNYDWPGNNIKFWNSTAKNSKWRWVIFGEEFSSDLYSSDNYATSTSLKRSLSGDNSYWAVPDWSPMIINKLLKNDDFKAKFIQRFAYHIDNTFDPDVMVARIDSVKALINNEYPYEAKRWSFWHSQSSWEQIIEDFRQWFRYRPDQMRQQIKDYFGISNYYNVNATADNTSVKFKVNDYVVGNEVDGKYFGGVNMKISASLPDGLAVDYWQVEGSTSKQYTLFEAGSEWKYYDKGQALSSDWTTSSTIDNSWSSGNAPLGYSGNNTEATKLSYGSDSNNKYPTYYFRKTVTVDSDPSTWSSATLQFLVDDGAVVYINGTEVARDLIDGTPTYDTWTNSYKGGVDDLTYTSYNVPVSVFKKGDNIIAVEVHQCSGSSSDIRWNASMTYTIPDGSSSQKITSDEYTFVPNSDMVIKLVTKQKDKVPSDYVQDANAMSLVVNEVQNYNAGTIASDNNLYGSWVEIYNNSSSSIDLAGLYLSNGSTTYMIPFYQSDVTTVSANGYLLFYLDGNSDLNALHTSFSLANSATTISLYQHDGTLISSLSVPVLEKNQSYGCKTDASSQLVTFSSATPYQSNALGTVTRTLQVYTDVDDIQSDVFDIDIYPNPTKDVVNIKCKSDRIEYTVLDLNGHIVLKGNSNQINVSHLKSGFYLVKVNGEIKKLIKL